MNTSVVLSLFLFLSLPFFINAHMYLSSLRIGGTTLPQGECVRITNNNSPIMPITHADMFCGKSPQGVTAANRRCTVAAGAVVGLQWYHEGPGAQDQIVDPSHKGPCLVYLAKDDGSANLNWFKIYEEGYDAATNTFCVTNLIARRGLMEATIPADIEPGNYLIRGETIALHEAYRVGGAQPYVGCGELTITGTGTAKPSQTVKFPGGYAETDSGLNVNIYNTPLPPYVIPGPAIYKAGDISNNNNNNNNNDNNNNSKESKKSGGMSGGGVAALVIFFLALAGVTAVGVFYYHKNGHIFGKTLPSKIDQFLAPKSNSSSTERKHGNYTAFVEEN